MSKEGVALSLVVKQIADEKDGGGNSSVRRGRMLQHKCGCRGIEGMSR
jgi:hypothetical protein